MSYQVLARKYRPASFEELEGQEHVLRALVNALENDRLHHAYLFTGTRGVGKTTIARILARCLNCEQGVTAKPCGVCSSCVEIAEGRSVDLIEVDAASRTKVEDTRELLDNVQYMPTHNRFKVYLIDEVHMLSTHSFNALLKTLEEPPEHVKFLLATTDPKKLPVTVLSRCLQFNLKNLSPERVVNYLKQILPVEGIEFEESALWLLGRAADGSMRDALSLTDQAISFGNNAVNEADVKMMLGSIDQGEVYALLDALIAKDGQAILDRVNQLADHAPDYPGLLSEMLAVLHRIALAHAVPEGLDNSHGDRARVMELVKSISAEDVQLLYQIGLIGQRDLPYAPNLRSGFEMILLRMLAFTPFAHDEDSALAEKKSPELGQQAPEPATTPAKTVASPSQRIEQPTSAVSELLDSLKNSKPLSAPPVDSAPGNPLDDQSDVIDFDSDPVEPVRAEVSSASPKKTIEKKPSEKTQSENTQNRKTETQEPVTKAEPAPATPSEATHSAKQQSSAQSTAGREDKTAAPLANTVAQPAPPKAVTGEPYALSSEHWVDILRSLELSGVTYSVASNCAMTAAGEDHCTLTLSESHASLSSKNHETRIAKALAEYYGREIRLTFELGETSTPTPSEIEADRREQARLAAVKIIEDDSNVQKLIENFDGTLITESIEARQQNGT